MNPNAIVERVAAPVIVNQMEPSKSGYSDTGALNNLGLQRLPSDVKDAEANIRYGIKDSEANIRYAVKDAEADIRHDVLFEGQENQKTSLEVEARLKDRLTIDRNASDAQFMNLGNRICDNEKEVIKMGYEARIEGLKNTERITDKLAHSLEEVREDLGHVKEEVMECCCEAKLLSATQTGLLNQIVKALIK